MPPILPKFRAHWKMVIGAALIGYATHGLLDAFTSYGTVLYWPWSTQRISWDVVAIIDPFFTFPLILGTTWSVINQKRQGVFIGLACATLFMGFNAIQHHRALLLAQNSTLQLRHVRAMPALASSTIWRVIGKQRSCWWIGEAQTPVWGDSSLRLIAKVPAFNQNLLPIHSSTGQIRDLGIFSWFSDGYLMVANENPLIVVDGRYTMGTKPVRSLWGIEFIEGEAHVRKTGIVPIQTQCDE